MKKILTISCRVSAGMFTLAAGLCLLAGTMAAQTGGGSSYSIFNIGDLRQAITAASAGHAGAEIAVPGPYSINSSNPACWSDLKYVFIQTALSFEQYHVSDSKASLDQNQTKLQDIAIGFPYSERWGGTAVFALRPYSTVNYRTALEQTALTTDSTTQATVVFAGSGGLSQMLLGTSFRPIPELAVGLNGVRYFGSVTRQSRIEFQSAGVNPATFFSNDFYSGYGARAGLSLQLLGNSLRLAAVYESGAKLDRKFIKSTVYTDNGVDYLDTTSVTNTTLSVPSRISLGASYKTGRFLMTAEGRMQQWDSGAAPNSRNTTRLAIGLDRLSAESINATGFERWTFRFGAYREQTYYKVNGQGIDQMGLTLGMGFPLTAPNPLNSSTAFDIGLEVGQRGTTDFGLTKELFARLSFGISLNELWFQRSRR